MVDLMCGGVDALLRNKVNGAPPGTCTLNPRLKRPLLIYSSSRCEIGAGGETRTPVEDDPRLFTKQVLSLLSHTGHLILDLRPAIWIRQRRTKLVEHQGNAPCIPVWKVLPHGHYVLSTPVLEMESRAGFAPASAVLQTAACAARLTGRYLGAASINGLGGKR